MTVVIRADALERLNNVIAGNDVDTIAVIGSEGSGKSSLMTAAAHSNSVPTKIVRSNSGETPWPYSGLSLFLAAIDELHEANFLALVQDQESSVPAFSVASALGADFRRTQLTPSAILIDDVDLFDKQSQEVLGFLFRRNSAKNLRTIVSLSEIPVVVPFNTVTKLLLEDLGTAALFDLGKSLSTPLARDAVLESIATVSSGNPLAYKSMLRAMPKAALNGEVPLEFPLRPGKKLARTMSSLLTGLPEKATQSLQILSCAGCIPANIYDQMSDASTEALDELITLGHVFRSYNDLVIKDPRLRATIYWSMSDGLRRGLHRELADLCSGVHRGQAAWHSSFVDPSNEQLCVDLLAEAGALVHRGLTQPAIEIAERVLTITQGDLSPEDFLKFLEPLILECEFNSARRYLQIIRGNLHPRPVPPDLLRLRVLVDFAQSNTIADERVVEIVSAFKDTQPSQCARLLAVTGLCHLQRWEVDEANDLARLGEEIDGSDSPGPSALRTALTLFSWAFAGEELPRIDGMRSHLETLSRGFGTEISWILVAQALSIGERYADARTLLNNVVDQSAHLPDIWINFARHAQFVNEYRAGDYHQVRAVYNELSAGYRHRDSFAVTRSLMAALVASADGDSTTALEAVQKARRHVILGSNPILEAMIAVRRARIDSLESDFDSANANFSRGRLLMSETGCPHLLRFHDEYIESLMYAGDTVSARNTYDELVESVRVTPSKWGLKAIARSHAMILTGDDSLEAFSTLLQSWTGTEHEYLRARTFFAYANRLKQLGYELDSKEARSVGHEIFREIGIGISGSICGHDDSSQTNSLSDLLTDKELPVVRLLAKGHKNQMIAHDLFVSVRTVELRLTNIYRKVGVKSRFELMNLIDGEFDSE